MAPSPPSVVIPHVTAAEFASRKFDYLVVGGGTAGLVVAARLSEDPSLTVGVLEAGTAGVGDPAIDVPGLYGSTLGTEYDWQFETVPQPGLAGRRLPWPRGKVLGGTSALNFMTWNRPSRDDFDAWERLGNAGWGWDGLLSVILFLVASSPLGVLSYFFPVRVQSWIWTPSFLGSHVPLLSPPLSTFPEFLGHAVGLGGGSMHACDPRQLHKCTVESA